VEWRPDACGHIWSPMTYIDASVEARNDRADVGAHLVMLDLTRPIAFLSPRNLTGNDLTLRWLESDQCCGVFGRSVLCLVST
jgi:hypothetical protein